MRHSVSSHLYRRYTLTAELSTALLHGLRSSDDGEVYRTFPYTVWGGADNGSWNLIVYMLAREFFYMARQSKAIDLFFLPGQNSC